jgi:Zn-finger nucleic acid-binding protein
MKRFKYRLYDLEMDFCEDGHGFWLDADEDKRILELMKQEEADLERKVFAEDRWNAGLQYMRSGSFLDRMISWQTGLRDVDFGRAIGNLMRRLRPPPE